MTSWTFAVILALRIDFQIADRDFEVEYVKGASLTQMRTTTTQLSIERRRWKEAVKEAGLDPANISAFGKAVPKFSASMVSAMAGLRQLGKRHHYNFQGRLKGNVEFDNGMAEWRRRKWVVEFARESFSSNDFFLATDAQTSFRQYTALGEFDVSLEEKKTLEVFQVPQAAKAASTYLSVNGVENVDSSLYDLDYYAEMAASNFTLCPGGDTPWSMRAYESAIVGAICLIRSSTEDWNPGTSIAYTKAELVHLEKLFSMYTYLTVDEPRIFSERIKDHNLETFIKYQTFILGDNVPP